MLKGFGHDLRITVVAALVASLATAVPTAAIVSNTDKVDGKHAVGAAATQQKRANKLVATDRNGHLPNNIIVKAPNANLLDGLDSTAFALTADEAFALSGPQSDLGSLTNDVTEVASVTLEAPGDGVILLTGAAILGASSQGGYIWSALSSDEGMATSAYWDAGDADGFMDQSQQITVAVPVTAGEHTYSLSLAESGVTMHSAYDGAQVTATYLPGSP